MNLYELTGAYKQLVEMLDDPETDQESFLSGISEISDEIEVMAENYAKIIRNIESSIESIIVEQKRLADRKNTLENRMARLKSDLQDAMVATGETKFKTGLFSFNVQKNGGAAPVVVDVPLDELPDEFVIVEKRPNFKALGERLKNKGDFRFAHFGERGESLRIR